MRSVVCITFLALAVAACGDNSGYGSAQDIAKAADCADFKTSSAKDGITVGECSYQGHVETVTWFPTAGSADGWRSLGPQHHSKRVLFDAQWMVHCASTADCAAFKNKLGGSFE